MKKRCTNKIWIGHLREYTLEYLHLLKNYRSGYRLHKRYIVAKCYNGWIRKGGTFSNNDGRPLDYHLSGELINVALQYDVKRVRAKQTREKKSVVSERVETRSMNKTKTGMKTGTFILPRTFVEKNNTRRVVGANTVFIEVNSGEIVKHTMITRTTFGQLRRLYQNEGIRSVFIVNPNIATTLQKAIIPEDKSMICICNYQGRYRIGITKKGDVNHCNLESVQLLLWRGDITTFLRRVDWDCSQSWIEVSVPTNTKESDGGFVNQIMGSHSPCKNVDMPLIVKDAEWVLLKRNVDLCPSPSLGEVSTTVYCKIPFKDGTPNLRGNIGSGRGLISIPLGKCVQYEMNRGAGWEIATDEDPRYG